MLDLSLANVRERAMRANRLDPNGAAPATINALRAVKGQQHAADRAA